MCLWVVYLKQLNTQTFYYCNFWKPHNVSFRKMLKALQGPNHLSLSYREMDAQTDTNKRDNRKTFDLDSRWRLAKHKKGSEIITHSPVNHRVVANQRHLDDICMHHEGSVFPSLQGLLKPGLKVPLISCRTSLSQQTGMFLNMYIIQDRTAVLGYIRSQWRNAPGSIPTKSSEESCVLVWWWGAV